MARAVDFFERQFQRQVQDNDYKLNPFETMSLEYLHGSVLDLGCGLGNLSLAALRSGCRVTAVDLSPTAVRRIRQVAQEIGVSVDVIEADLETYEINGHYDTIVAIGLLMFFRHRKAISMIEEIKAHVRPGGRIVLNVLTVGTTYMKMFEPGNYCLFRGNELEGHFSDWNVLLMSHDSFPAPQTTCKEFATIIAERPS